jgi:hypothetical protein
VQEALRNPLFRALRVGEVIVKSSGNSSPGLLNC